MNCESCIYNGGFINDPTTYSGLKSICNAPTDHLLKHKWSYANGAVLPGRHCGVSDHADIKK